MEETAMKRLGWTSVAAALAVTSVFVTAIAVSGATAGPGAAKIRIGLVLPDLSNPSIAGLRDGALAEAKKRGVTLLVTGTNDSAKQTAAVNQYIGAKVDLIAVDALDGAAITPAIKKANAAGIPVVATVARPAGGKIATFVAVDNVEGGKYVGHATVAWCKLKQQNPCEVGIVRGTLADQSARDEEAGMRSVVSKDKSIKIVTAQQTNWDPSTATNVAANMMTAHPDLDYIYAVWGSGADATYQAVKAKGKLGQVGVSSYGGACSINDKVLNGQIFANTMFFTPGWGALTIQKSLDVLNKKKLPKFINVKNYPLTTPLAQAIVAGIVTPPTDPPVMAGLQQAQKGCGAGVTARG
jgi:ABC-type sugar transport system substrate-binding protein